MGETRLAEPNWIDQLPVNIRESLLAAMQPRKFTRGALIYNRTEQPPGLYLIRSGSALFQIDGANGKRLLLKIIRENELFGETVAYDGKPSPIAVEARGWLLTDFISTDELAKFRSQYVEVDRALASAAVQNLRAALAAIEELNLMDLRDRTLACLVRLCKETATPGRAVVQLDLTQAELASMLGASRQATNAVLGEFETVGWLKRNFRNLECVASSLIS